MFLANQQQHRQPHRVNNHFLYQNRNKKKGVIIGGRKMPAELKATKAKPKRVQIKQKPATVQPDAANTPSESTVNDIVGTSA